MSTCTDETLCEALTSRIRGEAGDPSAVGIVQATGVDEVRHRAVLLGVGARTEKGGSVLLFDVCPYCKANLPMKTRTNTLRV